MYMSPNLNIGTYVRIIFFSLCTLSYHTS